MKILITGISGFVARHFIELLSGTGKTFIVSGIYFENEPAFRPNEYPGITCNFHKFNLLDIQKLESLLLDFQPDCILHLAGKSNVAESWRQPAVSITENTGIFLNIVERVRLLKLNCRILSIGSTEEYGNVNEGVPLKETDCPMPASPYGAGRVLQQKLVEIYSKDYGLDILHTRSFNHIGPYQKENYVISSFARQIAMQIKEGKTIIELSVGDVEVMRDFTDVRDVVKAYYGLMLHGKSGETYNVCSNNGIILKDVIRKYGEITGLTINYKTDAHNFRPAENKRIAGSYDKIKNAIGWEPVIPIEKSLADLLDYWKKMLEVK